MSEMRIKTWGGILGKSEIRGRMVVIADKIEENDRKNIKRYQT